MGNDRNSHELAKPSSSGRGKSKGTTLSRNLPFGEALEQSSRRARKHGRKAAKFDSEIDWEIGESSNFGAIKKFTIANDKVMDGHQTDDAIVEYNKKLRAEVTSWGAKYNQLAASNSANEDKVRELSAIEKVLKEKSGKPPITIRPC